MTRRAPAMAAKWTDARAAADVRTTLPSKRCVLHDGPLVRQRPHLVCAAWRAVRSGRQGPPLRQRSLPRACTRARAHPSASPRECQSARTSRSSSRRWSSRRRACRSRRPRWRSPPWLRPRNAGRLRAPCGSLSVTARHVHADTGRRRREEEEGVALGRRQVAGDSAWLACARAPCRPRVAPRGAPRDTPRDIPRDTSRDLSRYTGHVYQRLWACVCGAGTNSAEAAAKRTRRRGLSRKLELRVDRRRRRRKRRRKRRGGCEREEVIRYASADAAGAAGAGGGGGRGGRSRGWPNSARWAAATAADALSLHVQQGQPHMEAVTAPPDAGADEAALDSPAPADLPAPMPEPPWSAGDDEDGGQTYVPVALRRDNRRARLVADAKLRRHAPPAVADAAAAETQAQAQEQGQEQAQEQRTRRAQRRRRSASKANGKEKNGKGQLQASPRPASTRPPDEAAGGGEPRSGARLPEPRARADGAARKRCAWHGSASATRMRALINERRARTRKERRAGSRARAAAGTSPRRGDRAQ